MTLRDIQALARAETRAAKHTLAHEIPYYGFIDPGTILTYHGTLLRCFEVQGIDDEGREDADLFQLTETFAKTLRRLDEHAILYMWMHRRPRQAEFEGGGHPVAQVLAAKRQAFFAAQGKCWFENRIYLCLEFAFQGRPGTKPFQERIAETWAAWREALRGLGWRRPLDALRRIGTEAQAREIRVSRQALRDYQQRVIDPAVLTLTTHLAAFRPKPLDTHAFFEALSAFLNPDPAKRMIPPPTPAPLNALLPQSAFVVHPRHIELDATWLLDIMTTRQIGKETRFNQLAPLRSLDFELIAMIQWSRVGDAAAKRLIQRQRRSHTHSALRMGAGSEPLKLGYKRALSDRLDQATTDIELEGDWFGNFSLSLLYWAGDEATLARRRTRLSQAFQRMDCQPLDEDVGLFFAWMGSLPGNHHTHNFRKLLLTNHNVADCAPLFNASCGEARSPFFDGPCLAHLQTRDDQLFHFNLCRADNLNWLGLGKVGSGKSFGMKFFATQALKYGRCVHIIHTVGPDYDDLVHLLDGTLLRLDLEGRHPLHFYSLEDSLSPGYLNLLLAIWTELCRAVRHELTEAELEELTARLRILFRQPPAERHHGALHALVGPGLQAVIANFIAGSGRFGGLLDGRIGAAGVVTGLPRFTVIDYKHLKSFPELARACLLFLGEVQDRLVRGPATAGDYKFVWYDEVAELIPDADHPIAAQIRSLGRTGRKHGCSLAVVTQHLGDLRERGLDALLKECVAQYVFWPNDGIDPDAWRAAFGALLNGKDLDHIRTMTPKREFLLVTADGTRKVLQLIVDPWTRMLFESHPRLLAKKEAYRQRHGFPHHIDQLLEEASCESSD